ncbi:hypothetical protein [Geomonas ferrireducens]|uniref:hypothetical protein n=1 Tax=Geomonas ferrireducens TaxID=2570227 RepID=UPI0010A872F7|nr:hypothetical protein [Geomonas ferrireducens]
MKGTILGLLIFFPISAHCRTLGQSDFSKTGQTLYGGSPGSGAGVPLFKNSTGVKIGINTTAAGYAALMQHRNGSKAFGTSSGSQTIYTKKVVKGVPERDPVTADGSSFAASDWSPHSGN